MAVKSIKGTTKDEVNYSISETLVQLDSMGIYVCWTPEDVCIKKGFNNDGCPFWFLSAGDHTNSIHVSLTESESQLFADALGIEITIN